MIDQNEIRRLVSFVVAQVIPWTVGCLGHYVDSYERGVTACRGIRIVFGDFRKEGMLNIPGMMMQLCTYFSILIVFVWSLLADVTSIMFGKIWIVELFVIGIVIALLRDI